ncbi:MAG: hypothetical protein F9K32_08895 [Desulfobulbaceae bacterium]|nr:MAG: hypothetical protein F9K32_08895 [Desulfobulbaceae bacterium]
MNALCSHYSSFAARLALLCLLLLPAAPLFATQYEEDVSTGEYLFVKGMVQKISMEDRSLTLQQKRGPRVTIRVTPDTEFEGVARLEELRAKQEIKVWYRPGEEGNAGLKILKLPDLGC